MSTTALEMMDAASRQEVEQGEDHLGRGQAVRGVVCALPEHYLAEMMNQPLAA